ncbi:MAG TPA: ABC transporter permease subunit, partial [Armatimonadota bacterium]|nr:ABC transporter permease subunit [Armatimonadota bacterium]
LVAAFGRTGLDAWMVRNLGSGLMFEAWGIPLAQFMVAAAFCIRALKATFDGINPRLEHVARTLGCTPWQAFVRVALPLARNGIIAGAIMTWARAISEFGPVLFFCGTFEGKTDVLPIRMFLNMSAGQPAQAIVLAILMIAIAATALIAFKKLGGKGYLW